MAADFFSWKSFFNIPDPSLDPKAGFHSKPRIQTSIPYDIRRCNACFRSSNMDPKPTMVLSSRKNRMVSMPLLQKEMEIKWKQRISALSSLSPTSSSKNGWMKSPSWKSGLFVPTFVIKPSRTQKPMLKTTEFRKKTCALSTIVVHSELKDSGGVLEIAREKQPRYEISRSCLTAQKMTLKHH